MKLTRELVLVSLATILAVGILLCLSVSQKDRYTDVQPTEPVACRWLAEEMQEDGADARLIRNATDMCINYHHICGNPSGGAEVLSIYDNFGNNWETAMDIYAQDMDAAGTDKNECMEPLECKKHHTKCPPFLKCASGTCQ